MKIAYLLDTFPSPTETFIAREIAALRRRGFEITIFAINAGEGAHEFILPTRWKKTIIGEVAYFQGAGANWAQSWKANFDHIHSGWASYLALVALGASEESGVSWSFSGHARDLFVDGAHWTQKLQSAQFAAVCTRAGQAFLQLQAPEFADKILFAPHGLELDKFQFQESTAPRAKELKILSVGRLVEKKGFDLLLGAVAYLRAEQYSVELNIIGEGPQRVALEQQCTRLNINDYVGLSGSLPHEAVLRAMREADIFALPCRVARDGDRDGLPNVLLEAAACGVPIVAAQAGAVGEFVSETIGWICAPDDATDLAQTLMKVWREPDETLRRSRKAREKVERDFDIETNIEVLARAFGGE